MLRRCKPPLAISLPLPDASHCLQAHIVLYSPSGRARCALQQLIRFGEPKARVCYGSALRACLIVTPHGKLEGKSIRTLADPKGLGDSLGER